jgi:CRISPR-associated protein Cmx8
MAKKARPATVTVTYDLFDLPTAQHKAGLAGLLLQIASMRNRKPGTCIPNVVKQTATQAIIAFSEDSMKALFDDLYDADRIPGAPREKPFTKGKGENKQEIPPLRRVPITKTDKKGNEKTVEGYVYLDLTPSLATLRHYLPERGEWVRLWVVDPIV